MGTKIAAALAACVALTGAARADTLGSMRDESGKVTRISKGVFEIGIDGMLILAYDARGEESAFRSTVIGGGRLRWFARDNLSLELGLSGFYQSAGEDASDAGGIAAIGIAKYMRLGQGMFFAPGLSAGVLFGVRSVSITPTTSMEANLVGVSASVELPMVFYAWNRLDVRAGPAFRLAAGTATAEGSEGDSFTTVDGGFNVGFGYYF